MDYSCSLRNRVPLLPRTVLTHSLTHSLTHLQREALQPRPTRSMCFTPVAVAPSQPMYICEIYLLVHLLTTPLKCAIFLTMLLERAVYTQRHECARH
jgi:hypothetical protein